MALSMVSNVRRWRRLGATTVGDDSTIWSVIVITSPPSTAQRGLGRQGPTSCPCRPIRKSDRRRTPHPRQDLRPLGWLRQERTLNVMACVVKTVHGRVQGTVVEGGYAFLGIPYAAPPFGANRLRPPQPVTGWEGVRDATRMGPEPPQVAPPTTAGPRGGATEDWEDVAEAVRRRRPGGALRGLPEPQCLDARPRRGRATRHGVDPGRHVRAEHDGRIRRRALRPRWRRLRRPELAARRRGLPLPGGRHRQRRAARPGRRARVGAGEHRRLRWKPGQRHRLRRVSRRHEHRHASRDAPRPRACSVGPSSRAAPPTR